MKRARVALAIALLAGRTITFVRLRDGRSVDLAEGRGAAMTELFDQEP